MGNLFDKCLKEEIIEEEIITLWLLENNIIDSPIIIKRRNTACRHPSPLII